MPKKGYVEIDIEECKGCNLCVLNCPSECLALNTSDTNSYSLHYAYVVDQDKCIACMNCAVICPDAAITVYREVKQPVKESEVEQAEATAEKRVVSDVEEAPEGGAKEDVEGGEEGAVDRGTRRAAEGAAEGGKIG